MNRNLRVLALTFAVFAAFFFASASVASAQGHHDATVNSHANNGNANGNGNGNNNSTGTTQPGNNQPQPYSNADLNGNGANPGPNTAVPYISTRNGSPSLNGNGNGNAVGRPCAGCVGKADNKNPPGQQPGPSDHNAGYECDRNNGIGKSNPAHTGCASTTTVVTTTTVPTTTTAPTTIAPTTTTGGGGLTPSSGGQPQIGNPASATSAGATRHGSLAFTGLDSRLIALGALALVLAGLMLFFASKVNVTRRTD
jgi:hypothetical protein